MVSEYQTQYKVVIIQKWWRQFQCYSCGYLTNICTCNKYYELKFCNNFDPYNLTDREQEGILIRKYWTEIL